MNLRMNVRPRRIIFCGIILLLSLAYLYTNRTLYTNEEEKKVSLRLLLAAAIRAAEIGGFEVVAVHDQVNFEIKSKGKTKEGINDPVTEADYKSHCAMYNSLIETFPDVIVISEETSKNCGVIKIPNIQNYVSNLDVHEITDEFVNTNDVTIWIDPLDATKEFTENLLQYVTTMVCIAVKGKPIIGVIYKPFETKQNSSLFWTWVEHSASGNLKNFPKFQENKIPTLIVSRSHAGQVYNISKIIFGENVDIISAAGAGFKFLEVTSGNVSAYIHMTTIKKWDICAGTAILTNFGGTVIQLYDQKPITFESTDSKVLSHGLLATIRDHKWYYDNFASHHP